MGVASPARARHAGEGGMNTLHVRARGALARGLLASVLALAGAPARAAITPIDYYRMGEVDAIDTPGATTFASVDSVGGKNLAFPFGAQVRSDVGAGAAGALGSTRALNFPSFYGNATLLSTATDNFGLEAWVRPASVAAEQYIAYNGNTGFNGWGILIRSNGTYQALFGG